MQTTFDAATFEARLEAAIGGPQGLDQVTRIEFEIVPGAEGRHLWKLWQGDRLVFSAPGSGRDAAGYAGATRIILESLAGIPPTEPTEETSHAPTA